MSTMISRGRSAPTTAFAVPTAPPTGTRTVEVDVPVYNEERALEPSIHRLRDYLIINLGHPFLITIADNASTDRTAEIGRRLAVELDGVRYLRLAHKGRGRALTATWSSSPADICAYMDVDLSTDLRAFPPLIEAIASGYAELAVGSRLRHGSHVTRGPRREIISRCYNALLRVTLGVRFSDAQCGFKAIRRDVADRLLPQVQDTQWFFDTELLVAAQRAALRTHEIPVDWTDDPDSRVDVLRTAVQDLRGVVRLMLSRPRRPIDDRVPARR